MFHKVWKAQCPEPFHCACADLTLGFNGTVRMLISLCLCLAGNRDHTFSKFTRTKKVPTFLSWCFSLCLCGGVAAIVLSGSYRKACRGLLQLRYQAVLSLVQTLVSCLASYCQSLSHQLLLTFHTFQGLQIQRYGPSLAEIGSMPDQT